MRKIHISAVSMACPYCILTCLGIIGGKLNMDEKHDGFEPGLHCTIFDLIGFYYFVVKIHIHLKKGLWVGGWVPNNVFCTTNIMVGTT